MVKILLMDLTPKLRLQLPVAPQRTLAGSTAVVQPQAHKFEAMLTVGAICTVFADQN